MESREKRLLEENGTKLMVLKPSSIWAAAMADLDRRARNCGREICDMEPYAFHAAHVSKADSANDLIRRAIRDIEVAAAKDPPMWGKGRRSSKYNTRLLYSDVDLLKAALK